MFSILTARPSFAAVLFAALATVVSPIRADEVDYLPKGCFVVYSVDVAGFLKSKLFQEAKTRVKELDVELQKGLREEMGVPAANAARITAGAGPREGGGENFIVIIRTIKPTSSAEVKASRKPRFYQKDFTFKETKVGAHTIYQESYRISFDKDGGKGEPPPLQMGDAFCVVEGNLVLKGTLEAVKAAVERNKQPAIPASMSAALKENGLKDMLSLVVDISSIPEREKKPLIRDIGGALPGFENLFGSLQTLTVIGDAPGQVKVTASLRCKDAASAADIRKLADGGLVLLGGKLKDELDRAKDPSDKELVKSAQKVLGMVKLSNKGANVLAEVSVDNATAVQVMEGMFMGRRAPDAPKEPAPKEFKDDKK